MISRNRVLNRVALWTACELLQQVNLLLVVSVLACLVIAAPVEAQLTTQLPDSMSDVGIDDRSGDRLPLELPFTDSSNQLVRLGQLFDGQRPVILTFNYAECPMLCKLQLQGLTDSLKRLEWSAGEKLRVVSVSIDPSETAQQAAIARQNHLQAYGRAGTGAGWSFLTGSAESIRRVTEAAGFRYKYVPQQREFSHTAAAIICTPDGVISKYLYGVQFDPATIRLSLNEAADGRIGSSLDQLILFCFRYDSASGRYTPAAKNLMRLGAAATVVLLAACIVHFRFIARGTGT